jgi:hypothetical protein
MGWMHVETFYRRMRIPVDKRRVYDFELLTCRLARGPSRVSAHREGCCPEGRRCSPGQRAPSWAAMGGPVPAVKETQGVTTFKNRVPAFM